LRSANATRSLSWWLVSNVSSSRSVQFSERLRLLCFRANRFGNYSLLQMRKPRV